MGTLQYGHVDYLRSAHLVSQLLLVIRAALIRLQMEWFWFGGLPDQSLRQVRLQAGQRLGAELASLDREDRKRHYRQFYLQTHMINATHTEHEREQKQTLVIFIYISQDVTQIVQQQSRSNNSCNLLMSGCRNIAVVFINFLSQ
jgi:hypothetical protein